mgnify:FL=1
MRLKVAHNLQFVFSMSSFRSGYLTFLPLLPRHRIFLLHLKRIATGKKLQDYLPASFTNIFYSLAFSDKFLPFADILLLTADEMELLLDTREYQVGLFALLRGHTQLVVLETEEGVHALPRAVHAFLPGLSAPPEELAARLLYQISQELTLKKLMKCSAPALQTLL